MNILRCETRGRRQPRESRTAEVEVRPARVTLRAPWRHDRNLNDISVNVVLVTEVAPPEGDTPVEWILLTSLPIDDVEQVRTVIQYYCVRWMIELGICSINQALGLDHVRCKSPEMVRNELWTTLLGYNLIRTTAAAAALLHNKQPRQITFTGTCQYVLSSWTVLSSDLIAPSRILAHCKTLLQQISECEVANRPGRIEPRVLKRRRHRYKLMRESRATLKAKLQNTT